MIKQRLFCAVMSLTTGLSLMAQRLVFREKGSGTPLARVRVTLGQQSVFSAPDGGLELPRAFASWVGPITATKSGYAPLEISAEQLSAGQIFYLEPDLVPNLVVVRSKRKNAISQTAVSIAEAERIAPRGDPLQVTTFLPGVKAAAFRPSLVVRGSAPTASRTYVSGIEVPFIYHSVGGISVLPGALISDVTFSAGGFSAEFGDATGGIVEVETQGSQIDRTKSEVVVNLPIYSGFFHVRRIDENQTQSFSARRSYLDAFLSRVVEQATVVPFFYDAHYAHTWERSRSRTRLLSLSASDGVRLEVPGTDLGDASGRAQFRISTYFGVIGVDHTERFDHGLSLRLVPQVQFTRVNNRFVDSSVNIRSTELRLPLQVVRRLGAHKIRAGVEAKAQRATVGVDAPVINPDDPFFDLEDAERKSRDVSFRDSHVALWSEAELEAGAWRLVPGLRLGIGEADLDPRLLVSYRVAAGVQAKASLGLYSQTPSPQQRDPVFGNDTLRSEKVVHQIGALSAELGDGWDVEWQVFRKQGRDRIRSHPVTRFANTGSSQTIGSELLLRRADDGRFFGWLSYAWSRADERAEPQSAWLASDYDQRHNVNLVGNYRWNPLISLGARIGAHTGDRYTPVRDTTYDASLGKYRPVTEDATRNGETLPPFHQLDLFMTYDWLANESKLRLQAGVEYLAARPNTYAMQYSYDYRQRQPVRGVPPIPYLQVTGEF